MTDQPKHSIGAWVRPLYLYAACLVSLIVLIIGTTTIGNELIRRYIFGLDTDWYENPKTMCEYILTDDELSPEVYDRGVPRAVKIDATAGNDLTPEERAERYERCIENRTEDIKQRSKYQLASKVSNGTTMILVALPLFWLHWRLVQKERR